MSSFLRGVALTLLLLFALPAPAQTIADQPAMFVTVGGGLRSYQSPYAFAFGSFGVKIADATYSVTTIEQTGTSSSQRTGIARILAQYGPVSVGTIGDIGGATNAEGNVGLALAASGFLDYSIKKIPGLSITGIIRVLKSSVQDPANTGGIKPVYAGGITYRLGK